MATQVTINETAILERLAQKIAEYWDGRTIPVDVPNNAYWSDWEPASTGNESGDITSGGTGRQRVPGTYDAVTRITGYITAVAVGVTVQIDITYEITITNRG